MRAVTNCVTENIAWNTGSFSLNGDPCGINDGRSHNAMVSPITQPFARQERTAAATERTLIKGLPPETAGLKRKLTIKTNVTFPSIISGMIPGTADMTGEAAMIKAVTGVITAKTTPHSMPAVMTAVIRHRLTMGPVIYTLRLLKNWLTY